jgi:hypothetical protein
MMYGYYVCRSTAVQRLVCVTMYFFITRVENMDVLSILSTLVVCIICIIIVYAY